MARNIYVNDNEIKRIKKLYKEGKPIGEIAKEVHRSVSVVSRHTKDIKSKKANIQLPLDNGFTPLQIGDVDDNGIVELTMSGTAMYLSIYDVLDLAKKLTNKLADKLQEKPL